MKFTFKNNKREGRFGTFQAKTCQIKLNKKQVGSIRENKTIGYQDKTTGKYKIILMVEKEDIMEDNNPNCTWKNIIFKEYFETMENAKEWLNNNFEEINKKYKLHTSER